MHAGLMKSMPSIPEIESDDVKYLTEGGQLRRRSPMIESVTEWYLRHTQIDALIHRHKRKQMPAPTAP